jgi:hypothetical protein
VPPSEQEPQAARLLVRREAVRRLLPVRPPPIARVDLRESHNPALQVLPVRFVGPLARWRRKRARAQG